jgi:hypothetical protein
MRSKDVLRTKADYQMSKKLFGVGFSSMGFYQKSSDNIKTEEYICWQSMLRRCYDPLYQQRQPTYIGCTVVSEWHDFQAFGKWFDENYVSGWELDKDLLIPGNKVYGPGLCCFVPKEINTLLLNCKFSRGELPIGCSWEHTNGTSWKISVRLRIDGKTFRVGRFDTIEMAFNGYKNAKEAEIRRVAEKWKLSLPEKVYDNLINHKIKLTD